MRIEDNSQAVTNLLATHGLDAPSRRGSGDDMIGERNDADALSNSPERRENDMGADHGGGLSVQTAILPPETELRFHVDETSELIQVEFINQESGKTTQKIPSDEALKLHASLKKQVGVLMDRAF